MIIQKQEAMNGEKDKMGIKLPKQSAITQKEYNQWFGEVVKMLVQVDKNPKKLIPMLFQASKYNIRNKRGAK